MTGIELLREWEECSVALKKAIDQTEREHQDKLKSELKQRLENSVELPKDKNGEYVTFSRLKIAYGENASIRLFQDMSGRVYTSRWKDGDEEFFSFGKNNVIDLSEPDSIEKIKHSVRISDKDYCRMHNLSGTLPYEVMKSEHLINRALALGGDK